MASDGPIHKSVSRILHGGDYNPDQWLHMPEIIDEDFRLMPLSRCQTFSVGIFAWTALEPEEGKYTFDWLDRIMDRLAKDGHHAILATPSGARPAWMAQKYPEVLRCGPNRERNLFGARHNHCPSSPQYRRLVTAMNTELATRYGKHPATILWHLSNEYGGECHCPLCQDSFRIWLKARYRNDLDRLNKAWYNAFWSHTYTDWSQVESPAPHGEHGTHCHNLDWKRFVTQQCLDFIRMESAPLKAHAPGVPITTNLMGFYTGLDYWKFMDDLDLATWDNYPSWHQPGAEERTACWIAMAHDLNRSLKAGRPFLMMESSPGPTNWQPVGRLRRPGMHRLASLQSVAHGSDGVLYFQWRKSRGASEKFHGAVVDHLGNEKGRMFQEVAGTGDTLLKIKSVIGQRTDAQVAMVYDWENRWAIDDARGPRNDGEKKYLEDVVAHYHGFWRQGIACDVIDQSRPLDAYKVVVAPMSYMLRPGFAERVEAFVKKGGTLVMTYLSGIVDESDLCFLGGWPGPLRPVLGIWAEEIDSLYKDDVQSLTWGKNPLGQKGTHGVHTFADLIHAETAQVMATYDKDFYAGRPAVTVNAYGQGQAWYLAARTGRDFLDAFYLGMAKQLDLSRAVPGELPAGVSATTRGEGADRHLFVMNFNAEPAKVDIGKGQVDLESGEKVSGVATIPGLGCRVFKAG